MDPDLLGNLLDQHAAALELYARQWCDVPEDVVQDAFLKLAAQRVAAGQPGCLAVPGRPQRGHRRGAGRPAAKALRDGRGVLGCSLVRGRSGRASGGRSIRSKPPASSRALPIEEREVIVAHLWGGLTFEQIAGVAGCSSSTGAPAVRTWTVNPERTVGSVMSLVPPDPELNPIESALGRLAPARSRIDRDRLMFQAGVNSARSAVPAPLGLAVDRGLAGGRGAVRVGCPGGQARSKRVVVQQPAPVAEDRAVKPEPVQILIQAPPSQSAEQEPWLPAGGETLGLRRQVLRFGLEGLPDPPSLLSQADGAAPAPGADSETPGLLRRYEFNKVLDLGGPS